jgi:CRP-like cAMP-binding protein
MIQTASKAVRGAGGGMIPAYFPEALSRACELIRLRAPDLLYRRGTQVEAMYRVLSGSVRLLQVAQGGALHPLQRAEAGDWLIQPGPEDRRHAGDALVETDVLVLAVPAGPLRRELAANPAFARAWGLDMLGIAQRLHRKAQRLSLAGSRARVEHYLATESARGAGEVCLRMPFHAWAQDLGVRQETLSRTLSRMRAQGRLETRGRTLRLAGQPGAADD